MMFKKCTGCGHHWGSREAFLSDPAIKLIGYQVNFVELETGYFLFNHLDPACLTTLALPVAQFRNMYQGEVYDIRMTGSVKCPGHCLHDKNMTACPAKCECSFVREVMQVVLRWPKNEAA
ncbi:MAG: hypothetical protein WCS52_07490 [bacterium]